MQNSKVLISILIVLCLVPAMTFAGVGEDRMATVGGSEGKAESGAAPLDLTKRIKFDIPAQALSTALMSFSEQTGLQFTAPAAELNAVQTSAIHGELPLNMALEQLLHNTQFTYRAIDRTTIAITTKSVRLTQNYSNAVLREDGGKTTSNEAKEESRLDTSLDSTEQEIVVTGSHIHGSEAVGSRILFIDRTYIEKSGYATVQDVLKTISQNFGGGVTEDRIDSADGSGSNYTRGVAANLRGLGSDSTLVLVNGRRQPVGGVDGTFVDISSIAASAVERIEVLTDGASAIYGSDAVGGVVNIILRRDYQGAESQVRFGSFGGDADEIQFSQLLGNVSSLGSALVGYQYYERGSLSRLDRAYTATDDLRRYGGSDYRSFATNPGNILSPDTGHPAFAIPSGQDGRMLTTNDLLPGIVNYYEVHEEDELLPKQKMHTAFTSLSRQVSEQIELTAEGRFASRNILQREYGEKRVLTIPSSNPFFVNPFGDSDSIEIDYNFHDDLGLLINEGRTDTYVGTVGARADLAGSWIAMLTGSYGEERTRYRSINNVNQSTLGSVLADPDPLTAFNPFGDGSNTHPDTIEVIRATQYERAGSDVWSANVIVDGPLFGLLSGAAKIAVGIDRREERIAAQTLFPGFNSSKTLGREVSAAFTELALPISWAPMASKQEMHLSLASRYEDYSDFGTTFNPKLGLSWGLSSALKVRGTWGTSFKAPRLIELLETRAAGSQAAIVSLPDPQSTSPSGRSSVLVRLGKNAALKEETAVTWTVGVDFSPPAVSGLGLSITYFNIDYKDRIAAGGPQGNLFGVLFEEEAWGSIITRNPSLADIQPICNSEIFLFGNCAVAPAAIVDLRLRNLAKVKVSGVDLGLQYAIHASSSTVSFELDGTYTFDFERAVSRDSAFVDTIDTLGNLPSTRVRGSVSWEHGVFSTTASVNYTGSYEDRRGALHRPIDSWTTLDANASYQFHSAKQGLDGLKLSFSVINLLNQAPPFADVGFIGAAFGYDTANANVYGRIVSAQLVKSW